jgi:hypothetical protein
MSNRPLLVYCAYPILDRESEPEWVHVLTHVKENNLLTGIELYRPFYSLDVQAHLTDTLKENSEDLTTLVNMLNLDKKLIPSNIIEAIKLEEGKEYSKNLILKELWVLSKADMLIADLDLADKGERDMPLTLAKVLNIPTVGVTNKFIQGPWLSALTSYKADTTNLAAMVQSIANLMWENEGVK